MRYRIWSTWSFKIWNRGTWLCSSTWTVSGHCLVMHLPWLPMRMICVVILSWDWETRYRLDYHLQCLETLISWLMLLWKLSLVHLVAAHDRLKWVILLRVHLRGLLRDLHQVVVDLAVLVPENAVRVLYNDSRGLIADFLGLLVISQFRGVIHNVRDDIKRASAMLMALHSSI